MTEIVLMLARADRAPGDEELRAYCLREYGVERCVWAEPEEGEPGEGATESRRGSGGALRRLLDLLRPRGLAPTAV
jgi:hypothetical protein